ncbi:hypothetical protein NDU88_003843 [Pleurodeles waltl]|uniref:Uncharacterized protein n=1 Tax=Pleurodeles waltl TaxID=8319 RepID=A0AAV7PD94_PLEWA|nr:hypothetical protein NDU88_003843 [Pleurodeles waltl]
MSADAKVQEVLRLLREAGHLDMVREKVLHAPIPARKALSSVAAAILASSPQRSMLSKELEVSVRRWRSGRGEVGLVGTGKGNPCPPRAESVRDCLAGGPPSQRERLGLGILSRTEKEGHIPKLGYKSKLIQVEH